MMDPSKTGNGTPVIGGGTDTGAGLLGNYYNSANVPSNGDCPACGEKGKLKALETCRISFQDSICVWGGSAVRLSCGL